MARILVADPEQFLELGGDDENGRAVASERLDLGIDFRFGADVDAARRFIQNEHLRGAQKPLAEDHLLLVAA